MIDRSLYRTAWIAFLRNYQLTYALTVTSRSDKKHPEQLQKTIKSALRKSKNRDKPALAVFEYHKHRTVLHAHILLFSFHDTDAQRLKSLLSDWLGYTFLQTVASSEKLVAYAVKHLTKSYSNTRELSGQAGFVFFGCWRNRAHLELPNLLIR